MVLRYRCGIGNITPVTNHELIDWSAQGGPARVRILASIAGRAEWAIEALVLITDEGPGVAELKIRPRGSHAGGGIPSGGITTRLMREINVGELIDLARDCVRSRVAAILAVADDPSPGLGTTTAFDDQVAATLRGQAKAVGALTGERKRPGKRGNGIDHYLKWASLYAGKVAVGVRNPNVVLADEFGVTPEYVRDTVTDARRRYGLLTLSPGRGRAGGTLSPKALALIAEQGKRTDHG
jgi:hypothetical protein